MVAEVEVLGFGEEVYAIERVEAACETAGEFEVLFLIFSDRHSMSFLDEDVDGHEGGDR